MVEVPFPDYMPWPGKDICLTEGLDRKLWRQPPFKNMPTWIQSHIGLGDQLYLRPFVRWQARESESTVYFTSPWPDLFEGIANLKLVRYRGNLRTQEENQKRQYHHPLYVEPPVSKAVKRINPSYVPTLMARGAGVFRALEDSSNIPFESHLFRWEPPRSARLKAREILEVFRGEKVCLMRPLTDRKEWQAPARNPDFHVWGWFLDRVRSEGFKIISVASCKPNIEEIIGPYFADLELNQGELSYSEIGALMQLVDFSHYLF